MAMSNPKIAVIGAGLMGHGIAQLFALAGHIVTIHDPVKANLGTAEDRKWSLQQKAALRS